MSTINLAGPLPGSRQWSYFQLPTKQEWAEYFGTLRELSFLTFVMLTVLGALVLSSLSSRAEGMASPPIASGYIARPVTEYDTPPVKVDPLNWLDGQVTRKGSPKAVAGAYEYATRSGYVFATNDAELDQLVGNGTLVELEGPYLELVDVSTPYVLPVVKQFANRLAFQYASKGCGKLVVTSAVRTIEYQQTLENGSGDSVHPTGMALDLRRNTPQENNNEEVFCHQWLEDTLLAIEGDRRLDVTLEDHPRHFHVVVVPKEYQAWLDQQSTDIDSEIEFLAMALFFEGAFDESYKGYQAIAAVIKNRVRSSEYPNTIVEVVAEGAAGRYTGSCQFSFMCDGKVERREELCRTGTQQPSAHMLEKCEKRWKKVVRLAKRFIASEADPTRGAVLYYTGKTPYWAASDMRGPKRKIGSHWFACSRHRGDDACTWVPKKKRRG